MKFSKFLFIAFLLFLNDGFCQTAYVSPYSLQFTTPRDSLIYDILFTERGDFKNSANVPYSEWYSDIILRSNGAWGPQPKHFSYPEFISNKSSDWLRERIVALAELFIGYGYQHHHIPDWDPPSNWKWKQTCAGSNGKGVDCSNFTSFVYNVAMGIKLNSNVKKQSEQFSLDKISKGKFKNVVKITKPSKYEDFQNTFLTGDLIFINSDRGEISHVVIWLGRTGVSPNGNPLIMDSHGAEVKDSEGNNIPCGIHIRPFSKDSWYYKSMQFGLRIIQ